jgi:hypothetical protein
VPADTPFTIPENVPIIATAVLLLLHVPPGVGLVSIVVVPRHALSRPDIGLGSGFTVTVVIAVQPNNV